MKLSNVPKLKRKFNYSSGFISRLIAFFLIPIYLLSSTMKASADEIPLAARIAQVIGLELLMIRRGRHAEPATKKSTLKRHVDTLIIPGKFNAEADLRFYGKYDKDLGIVARAIRRNDRPTLYYFPCTIQGNYIIEWANENFTRGCESGIRVQRTSTSNTRSSVLDNLYSIEGLKNLFSQSSRSRFQYHCLVQANDGQGWLDVVDTGSPCEKPLEQCVIETSNNNCKAIMLDRWQTHIKELIASVECANDKNFTTKSDGSTFNEALKEIWKQAQSQDAKYCKVYTYSVQDIHIAPQTQERLLTRIIETEKGSEIEVIAGSVVIRNAKVPDGVLIPTGQRYIYSDIENNGVETFNADAVLQSPEIQDFLEDTKPLPIAVGNPADAQYVVANLPDGEHQFCSKPDPKNGLTGAGVCFWFRKEGNRVTGRFGYPHSGEFVDCVTGIMNDNSMTGEALDLSWPGHPLLEILPNWTELPQETFAYDEDGYFKLGQGKILRTERDQFGDRTDWIYLAFASLDLKGFYRYSIENLEDFKLPKTCSLEDNLYEQEP